MRSLAIGCALLGAVACSSAPPFVPPSSTGSSTGAPTTTAGANGTTGGTTGGTTAGTTGGTTAGTTGSSTGRMTSSGGRTTGTSSGGNGTTTGSYIGLPCTFNATTFVDSCQPYGYECSLQYDTTDPGTCNLPREFAECFPDVGCQGGDKPALVCTAGFSNSAGKNIDACAYPCKTTNDCVSTVENCIPGVDICYLDYCGQTNGKFTGPYYKRCTVDDGGDTGQCLSFNKGTLGLCEQNGFDFTGEPCNVDGRVGPDSQCDFGDVCLGNFDTMGNYIGDAGTCVPITTDGGCVAGYDAFQFNGQDWQDCFQDCTTDPTSCTAGICFLLNQQGTEAGCIP